MSELPINWIEVRFLEIFDIQGGTQPPKSTFIYEPKENYVRLLQIRDFGDKPVPTYILDIDSLKRCNEDDILIARYGASIGRILTGKSGAYNVAMAKVDIPVEINRRFTYHLLNSKVFQSPLGLISRSAQNGFNKDDLSEFKITIPPFNEQKRIADKLDSILARVDACRERLDRIPAILKRFRQAVFAAATSGKLTEEWRNEIGIHINDWKSVFLKSLVRESSNGLSKRRGQSGKETIVLRLADFKNSERIFGNERTIILNEKEQTKYSLLEEDLLVVRVNGSREISGKFIAYKKTNNLIEAYCDHFIRLRLNVECVIPKFAVFVSNSGRGRKYIESVLVTSAGQNTINQTALFGLSINLPSLSEQTEIVRRVEELFAYADRIESRYHAARAQVGKLTPAILAKAFRGELVPQDPNDEPASVLLDRIRASRAENALTPKPKRSRKPAAK